MTAQRSNQSMVQHQDIVENSLQGIMVIASEGIVFANQAVAKMTGYSVQELEEFSLDCLWEAIHQDDRQNMMALRSDRLAGRPVPARYEFKFLHKTEGELLLEVRPTVVQTSEGSVIQAYVLDKSDQCHIDKGMTKLERHLCRSQKMAAVGRLAGGIAHDLNNNLFIIVNSLDMLKDSDLLGNTELELLAMIEAATRDASTLATRLLKFAHAGSHKVRTVPVNLSLLVDEVINLLQATFREKTTIEKRVLVDLPFVQGDPVQLRQAFMNLMLNAHDAMPGGGVVRIRIWEQVSESGSEGSANRPSERHLVVAVSDTGIGISEETQHCIFEPFFTTKEPEKGTGMGLAMVHSIVESHNGSIYVESTLGKGTTFRVCLPSA